MKIVYTGGEFLLSNYLNFLKVPMVVFFIIILVKAWTDCLGYDKSLKDTYLYRNRYWLAILAGLSNLYMFVMWH